MLTSGGATRLVDGLEKRGLVERLSSSTDRRVSLVQLTDHGIEMVDQATRIHLDDLDEHFSSRFGPDELTVFNDLLDRVRLDRAER